MKALAEQPVQQTDISRVDEIEVTSRLLNIILDMPVNQQLELLKKLDSTQFKGVRKQARTKLKSPWFVVIEPGKNIDGKNFIKDISRCGMFIETRGSFAAGEKILLTFQIPTNRKIFKIVGEIVRSQPNGVGVKFRRLFTEKTPEQSRSVF